MSSSLKITQQKSVIGTPEKHRIILKGLGLKGRHSTVIVENTPAFRGMIKKVIHLVKVEENND